MRLLFWLLRSSWPTTLVAALIGGLGGAASVGLIALIMRALRAPEASVPSAAGPFAALCLVVLITRVGAQWLLANLTRHSISRLRMGLCQRILSSPLRHIEEIGSHRLMASLTGDVNMVASAMNGIPALAVNVVILACGTAYLGWLSPSLMLWAVAFCVLGITTYWISSRWAATYVRRARQAEDGLHKRIQELVHGLKTLKMHHERRRVFLDHLARADALVGNSKLIGDGLFNAAITWGRLTFLIAIGLLIFAWPRFYHTDAATLTGYTLTILYLMVPLEQIVGWLPFLMWATGSANKIDRLGLRLDGIAPEETLLDQPPGHGPIRLRGVTHGYRREGSADGFVLGPIDLAIDPGEVVFIIGGNGSGKTTLAKLITGLYVPDSGEILSDGQPVTAKNREAYRQLFSAVFDDATLFEALWGLDRPDLDSRAQTYLRLLGLDRVVAVRDGSFSTTDLSRGQKKRLALVTAYLEDRPIYLFDEWAADQDPESRQVFYTRLLPGLREHGKTVIAITHDDRYFTYADKVIKLEEGKIVDVPAREAPEDLARETAPCRQIPEQGSTRMGPREI
ncbi:MAG: cyclic peptide export ABC transporter [Verrucomicrobiae bacterium]|nr:cyclic peptide export ABC transporter [Verrucomicrobiae bacterium]